MTVLFCGDCGAARPTPANRFCVVCGVAYEGPSAQKAAPAPAPAPAAPQPAWTPSAPAPAAQAWSAPVDYAVPTKRDAGRGGRSLRVVGAAAVALALAGAGLVGWQLFGPAGGADSPDAAARQFLTAVAEQDGVALLQIVNPGEASGLDEVYGAARDRLEKEGLVSGPGLSDAADLELTGLEFEVDLLGDEIARVTLSAGTATVSYDPEQLPDRLDFIADEYPDAASETIDLDELLDEDDFESIEAGLIVVEVDGSWYVSLFGTAADLVHQELDRYNDVLRDPDYDAVGEDFEPVTGDTPEAVLENIIEAGNNGDVEGLLNQLPDDVALGLRPYVRPAERFLQDYEIGATVEQNELRLDVVDEGGDLVRVYVDEAGFSAEGYAEGDYGSGEVEVYDACVIATDYEYGYEDGYCAPDNLLEDLGIDRPYVMMREVGDGFQFDPVATVSSIASTVIESYPSQIIDELVSALETGDDDFFECRYGSYCDD